MELLTKELREKFKKQGRVEDGEDPMVICKFFNPTGRGTWYAIEYNEQDKIFYGYVSIFGDHNDEFGDFTLEELESLKLPMGLGIERDLYWESRKLSVLKKELNINY